MHDSPEISPFSRHAVDSLAPATAPFETVLQPQCLRSVTCVSASKNRAPAQIWEAQFVFQLHGLACRATVLPPEEQDGLRILIRSAPGMGLGFNQLAYCMHMITEFHPSPIRTVIRPLCKP